MLAVFSHSGISQSLSLTCNPNNVIHLHSKSSSNSCRASIWAHQSSPCTGEMPKGHSCNCKQWVKEGWIRAVALLRLWGCNYGVSNDSLLAWQWGVLEEGSKGTEQYANYSNYGNLIDNRNDRYKGGEVRILRNQRGEEKVQGELGCVKQSARCDKRSVKCEVSGLERMNLIKGF